MGLPLLLVLYAPLIRSAWRIRKDADNPHRFVKGSFRHWAQGHEKLERAVKRLRSDANAPSR